MTAVKKSKKIIGRPPDYVEGETVKQAQAYLDSCIDREGNVNLPKAEGLALWLDVHRDTLYDWAKKYKPFSDILEKINQEQSNRVINKALGGQYNANIAKLLLGKHGYHEKLDTDLTTKGEKIEGLNLTKAQKVAEKYEEELKQNI